MKLCLIGHSFGYELEKLIRIFLPFEKIEICEGRDNSDRAAVTVLSCENGVTRLSAELILGENTYTDEKTLENSAENYEKECERLIALPNETKVYPGHGDFTTVGYEKENNMFVW